MPRKCYIPGCTSNSGKFTHYTPVFSFPKQEDRRRRWIDAVKNEFKFIREDDPGVNACVCVHHFEPDFVEKQPQIKPPTPGIKYPALKLRLIKDAIPTIFKPNLETSTKKKKGKKVSSLRKSSSSFNNNNETKEAKPKQQQKIDSESETDTNNQPSLELIERIKDEQIKINIYSTFLKDYGPEYYNTMWDRTYRVLKESADKTEKNPLNLTIDEVSELITKTCQNADIGELFREQLIDGAALLDLSKEDLVSLLGLKLGPCIKISTLVERLRDQVLTKFIVSSDELE